MHREPTEEARERLLRPKGKTSEATREEISKLSAAYLEARNSKLRAQALMVEAQAKEKAEELISKELVTRQAQYILICLRQSILNFPTKYARVMVALDSEHEAKPLLTKAAHEFLNELVSFPEKIINPNWLQTLEGNGEGQGQEGRKPRISPATGAEIKAEQKKAKMRRAKKTETMRRSRSKG
jgi:hypothetical protein